MSELLKQPIALILFPDSLSNDERNDIIKELIEKLKKVAPSIEYIEWLGKHFMRVTQSQDLDAIPEIVNIILQEYPLQIWDGTQTHFPKGYLYTIINHQQKFLQDIINFFKFPLPTNERQADQNWHQITTCGLWRQIFFKNQFWKIKEAQDFFATYFYRKLILLPDNEMPTRFGSQYFDTSFTPYPEKMNSEEIDAQQQIPIIDLDDNEEVESPPTKKRKRDKSPIPEIEECIICQENKASTIAFDCGHSVLCEECSLEIKKSGSKYRTKCLQCTQNINSVYYTQSNKLDTLV